MICNIFYQNFKVVIGKNRVKIITAKQMVPMGFHMSMSNCYMFAVYLIISTVVKHNTESTIQE